MSFNWGAAGSMLLAIVAMAAFAGISYLIGLAVQRYLHKEVSGWISIGIIVFAAVLAAGLTIP